MKYFEQFEAFKRLSIQQGISRMVHLQQAMPFGCTVPQGRLNRWFNELMKCPAGFSTQRRYVNRFKLGADPEFVFCHQGERIDARLLNLAQGLAFGMDNNGRLTELRPYPSRSAVEVVASLLAAMRWMSYIYPGTLTYSWVAGAFILGDGLGGHVHFGRKRPARDLEIKALDAVDDEMIALKAYPILEIMKRRQGDARNQIYGAPGDFRKQIHGYEYRTLPSWLDSPALAFLSIVLSKLAVHNPSLLHGYAPLADPTRQFYRVRNLLAYYKDVDDDARLALMVVNRAMPKHLGGDFKARWGLDATRQTAAKVEVDFIPSSIKPSTSDIAEMFVHLSTGTPLVDRMPEATWSPLTAPKGYAMAIKDTQTYQCKGLGEMLWDVVRYADGVKGGHYSVASTKDMNYAYYFSVPRSLAQILPAGWKSFCKGRVTTHDERSGAQNYILSNSHSREAATFHECRRILLETVFPFWKISDVKSDSYQQWLAMTKARPVSRYMGQIITGDPRSLL